MTEGESTMKHVLAVLSASLSLGLFAGPTVSDVTVVPSANSPKIEVRYKLDQDAVVTVRFIVGGTDVPGEQTQWIGGDVGQKVLATSGDECRSIYWAPDKEDWGEGGLPDFSSVVAVVSAWALDAPPDYMVVDLVISNRVSYYASTNFIPGGVLDDMYKTNKMVFRKIPAKNVTWKSGLAADGTSYYRPHRYLLLTNDYYIGIFEVTRAQSRCYCKRYETGNGAWRDYEDYPMRALAGIRYGEMLGNVDNLEPSATSDLGKFRALTGLSSATLPTEAQWDYACRGRSGDPAYWGSVTTESSALRAFTSTSGGKASTGPQKVGQLLPNSYGLYDMLGNASECCLDYKYSWAGDTVNVTTNMYIDKATAGVGTHIMMGGSYANDIWYARNSCYFGVAEDGAWNAGYRIVVDAIVK